MAIAQQRPREARWQPVLRGLIALVAALFAPTLVSADGTVAAPDSQEQPAPSADDGAGPRRGAGARGSAAEDSAGASEGAGDDDVDPSDLERPRPHYDYSRFSDGPRRVPTPRGPAFERARRLGLGTRDTATHLLTRAPERRWINAVRGRPQNTLLWPVANGRFGRGFGFTRRERRDLRHNGVDVGAPRRAVIRAAADGIVAYSDNGMRGYGNAVLIVHANGWVTLYGHAERTLVQAGYRVRRGERIALVGSTGIARGAHLHFELRDHGRVIDPMPHLVRVPGRPRGARRGAVRTRT